MGWDGDDLAGQAEDANDHQQAVTESRAVKTHLTPEERARNVELESLRLSRSRVLSQLEKAVNPAHRRMLESALQSIEEKMRS